MRIRSRVVALACGVVLFALVSAGEASACSCVFGGVSACQEFWQVDAVFAGTATRGGTATADEGSYKRQVRVFTFSVAEVFRGESVSEVEVATGMGGGDCGYGFRVGETYLVYASRNVRDGRLSTGICHRTKPLARAAEDLAFIRALPQAEAGGVVFGTVGRRNHAREGGEDWFKPVAAAELVVEGEGVHAEARTDAAGRFRVAGLAPGAYKVKAKLPRGLTYWKVTDDGWVESETKVADRGCAETWFIFDADTRVAGRVIDALGQPVAGLRLDMRGASPDKKNVNTFLGAQTDAGGRFEFKTVPPGDYLLGLRLLSSSGGEAAPYPRTYYPGVPTRATASVVTVKEGEGIRDLELRLPPRLAERTVEGFVVWADGRPAPGVIIYQSLTEEGDLAGHKSLRADERGRFTLKIYDGLKYAVSAYPQGATGAAAQSPWVEVAPAGSPPIKLVLPLPKK
jgi:hypothetical protein